MEWEVVVWLQCVVVWAGRPGPLESRLSTGSPAGQAGLHHPPVHTGSQCWETGLWSSERMQGVRWVKGCERRLDGLLVTQVWGAGGVYP